MWGSIFGSGSKAKKSKSGEDEGKKRPVSSQEARRKAKLERQKDLRARRKNSVTEFYVSESSNSESSSDDDTPAKDSKKNEYSKVGSSQFDDEPVEDSSDDSRVSENPLHSKSKAAVKMAAFKEPEDEPESESEEDDVEFGDDEPENEPQLQNDDEPADGDDGDEPRDSEEPDSEEESSSEDESSMVSDKAKKYEWELEDVDMEAALVSFYTKYNPERVATVSEIVDTYDGEFTLMLRVLCDRYHLSHGQMDMFLDIGRSSKHKKSGGKSPAKSALKKRDSVDNSGDDGRGRRVSISTDHNTVTHIETKDEVKEHLKESARERARARERAARRGDDDKHDDDNHPSESDSESESEGDDGKSMGSDERKTSHAPAPAPAPAFMSEEEVREKEKKEKKKARDDKRRDKNYQRMKEKLAQTQKAFMMQQQHQQQLLMLHERQQAHLKQGQSTGIPPSPVSYMSPQQQAQMLALQQQQAMLQAHIYGLGGDPMTMTGIEPVSDLHMSPTQLERAAGGGKTRHGEKPSPAEAAAASAADEKKKKEKATIGGGKHLGEAVLRLRQQEDDAARELERMRKAKDDALSEEIKKAELEEIEAQKNAERDRAEKERERARVKSAAIIAEQRRKKGIGAPPSPTSSPLKESSSAAAPMPAASTDPSVISQLAELRKELAATKAALAESAEDRTQVMTLLKQVVTATNSIASNPPSPVGSASNSRASSPAPSRQRETSGVAATPTVAPLVSELPPDLDDPSQLAASVAAILTRAASPAPSRSASPASSVRSRSPGPGTPLLHQRSNNTNMVQSIVAGTGGGTPQPLLYAPKPYRQEQQGGVAADAPTSLGNNNMLPPSATPLVKGAVKGASAIAASGPGSSVRSRASEKVRGATPHTTNGAPMTTSKQAGMRKVGPPDDDWYECWNPALGKTYFHSASRNKSAWTAPFPVYEVEPTDDASVDSNYYYSAAGAGAAAAADAKTDYSVNLNGQQQGTPAREGGGDIYDDSSIASGSSRSRSPAAQFVMQPLSVQGSANRGRIASANARKNSSDGNSSVDSRGMGSRGRSPSPFREGGSVGSHGGRGTSPAPAHHVAQSSVSPTTRIGAQRRASNLHSPSSRAMAEAQHQLQASEYLHHHPMLKHAQQNPFQAREERRLHESGQQQLAKVAGDNSYNRQRTKSPAQQHAYQRSRQGLVGGGVAGQLPPPTEIHSSRTSTDGRPVFLGVRQNMRAPSPSNRGGGGDGIDAHSNLPYSRSSSPRVRGSSSPGAGSSGYTNYANMQVKNKRSGNMNVMAEAAASPHMNMPHTGDPNRPQYRPPSTAAPGFGDSGPQFLPPDDYDDMPNSIGMFSSSSNNGSSSRGGDSRSSRKNAGSPGPRSPNRFAQAHADAEAAKSQWREALSKTGKRYYYNVVTRESTYRRPPLYMPLQ